jgi:large subunit ribosomal protein L10
MSANRQAKEIVVSEIREKLEKAKSAVLIDYIGLTVQEVTELRNRSRAAGIEYKVLKNTMISRAADMIGISGLENLSGPTAVAFSYTDPTAGAKIILDYQKKTRKTKIKLGLLGKTMISAEDVADLSKIPSKEVLIAQLMSVLNGPARGFVTVLSGPARGLVTALNAIKNQKESA